MKAAILATILILGALAVPARAIEEEEEIWVRLTTGQSVKVTVYGTRRAGHSHRHHPKKNRRPIAKGA